MLVKQHAVAYDIVEGGKEGPRCAFREHHSLTGRPLPASGTLALSKLDSAERLPGADTEE